MSNHIQKIFMDGSEMMDLLKDIHESNIGRCATCQHHTLDVYAPGFISEPESCKAGNSIAHLIAVSQGRVACNDYKEKDISEALKVFEESKKE